MNRTRCCRGLGTFKCIGRGGSLESACGNEYSRRMPLWCLNVSAVCCRGFLGCYCGGVSAFNLNTGLLLCINGVASDPGEFLWGGWQFGTPWSIRQSVCVAPYSAQSVVSRLLKMLSQYALAVQQVVLRENILHFDLWETSTGSHLLCHGRFVHICVPKLFCHHLNNKKVLFLT